MQAKPYRIVADPTQSLITITFDSVFWDMAVAEQFMRDCTAAVVALGGSAEQHLILVDLHNAVVQSQDVFDKMLALVGSATAARIALVASAPLARMQTKRLQVRDGVVMFATVESARAWLLEPATPRQVA